MAPQSRWGGGATMSRGARASWPGGCGRRRCGGARERGRSRDGGRGRQRRAAPSRRARSDLHARPARAGPRDPGHRAGRPRRSAQAAGGRRYPRQRNSRARRGTRARGPGSAPPGSTSGWSTTRTRMGRGRDPPAAAPVHHDLVPPAARGGGRVRRQRWRSSGATRGRSACRCAVCRATTAAPASWQNTRIRGTTAFVVELPPGHPTAAQVARYRDSVDALALSA